MQIRSAKHCRGKSEGKKNVFWVIVICVGKLANTKSNKKLGTFWNILAVNIIVNVYADLGHISLKLDLCGTQ